MDGFVVRKLKEWSLEQFTERFEKGGIDQEMFFDIDEKMLAALFEKGECGYQKKFEKRLEALKNEISQTASNIPPEENALPSLNDENANAEGARNTVISCADSAPTRLPLSDISNQLIAPVNSLASTSSPSLLTPQSECTHSLSSISVVAVEYAPQAMPLLELFKMKHKGGRILEALENGKLKTRLIAEVVIDHEFDVNKPNYSINRDRFFGWNEELVVICKDKIKKTPEQIKNIFYFPFQKATKTAESVNAGGCMYDGYTNKRGVLIAEGIIPRNQVLQEDKISTTQEQILLWLFENDGPWVTLIENWLKSLIVRGFKEDFKEHFQLYKGLRNPTIGHLLWSSDYDGMHPDCPSFQEEFKVWTPIILGVARNSNKLEDSENALIAIGKDYIAAAICLVRLLCNRILKRKSDGLKTSFGNTTKDLIESFIVNKPDIASFDSFIEKRHTDSANDKRPIGPFVTLVGDFLDENKPVVEGETPLVRIFVTVNSINFELESTSLLDALDFCYKSFASLNIPYPIETHFVWDLIQKLIYKKNFKKKTEYACVRQLIDKLVEAQES
ncbi:hypothetical protein QAD02_014252 [Eretmocerus hayati]|uniref:Uncharacterized protein n=1 Tax=Eretmocerus hayati TaxID=131215 RepID=A0ACC2P9K8_9HYME|nr:hypothetical protein QAD02_014252 [Eretmocerus hayati]